MLPGPPKDLMLSRESQLEWAAPQPGFGPRWDKLPLLSSLALERVKASKPGALI